jgi:hypothetical protein
MTTKTLNKNELAQFTGSENWYRHGINRNVLYTDGARHVADHGGAYWLLDEIAIIQPYNKAVAAEEFQVWNLAVRHDRTATLTCDDGNGNIVFTKEIEPHPRGSVRRASGLVLVANQESVCVERLCPSLVLNRVRDQRNVASRRRRKLAGLLRGRIETPRRAEAVVLRRLADQVDALVDRY